MTSEGDIWGTRFGLLFMCCEGTRLELLCGGGGESNMSSEVSSRVGERGCCRFEGGFEVRGEGLACAVGGDCARGIVVVC